MAVRLAVLLLLPTARSQPGCVCEAWEDHPNTYWSGGEQTTKDGISLQECKDGCCNSDECIAYGHCMDGPTSCIWPIPAQHCTWYKTRGGRLTRSDGHFTGIFHAASHCTAVPGANGDAGDKMPDFETEEGWEVVVMLCAVALMYGGAGVARRYATGSGSWVPNMPFWSNLIGLVHDGAAFSARPAMRRQSRHGSAAVSRATTGEVGLGASLISSSAAASHRAGRGRPTELHVAASVGQVARLQAQIDSARPGDLDACDTKSYTPFHVACAGGHTDCVRALLVAGCDPMLRCDTGYTGWELAAQLKRDAVVALQRQSDRTSQNPPRAARRKHKKAKKGQKERKVRSSTGPVSPVRPTDPASATSGDGPGAKRVVM